MFFLLSGIWGILKARVNSPRPQTMVELRMRLDAEINRLGQEADLLRRCVANIVPRAEKCLAARGGYFEN